MRRHRSAAGGEPPSLPRVVLVDANVFFAPRMRDLFMHLHATEVIAVHWTKEIEAEWTRNVVAKQEADPRAIQACLEGMREAAPGWEVTGYGRHAERFEAVDAKDRHVAAAAYKLSLGEWPSRSVGLVTKNVKDFPQRAFAETEVTRYSMSGYLDLLNAEMTDIVAAVAEGCRKKLRSPRLAREEYVAVLMKNGCSALAQSLAARWKVECPAVRRDGTLYYESEAAARPARLKPQRRSRP